MSIKIDKNRLELLTRICYLEHLLKLNKSLLNEVLKRPNTSLMNLLHPKDEMIGNIKVEIKRIRNEIKLLKNSNI